MRRLGGVAESPEKLVAAPRGGHPTPPLREMEEFAIFDCRFNKFHPLSLSIRFRILPVALLGSSGTKSIRAGALYAAR